MKVTKIGGAIESLLTGITMRNIGFDKYKNGRHRIDEAYGIH